MRRFVLLEDIGFWLGGGDRSGNGVCRFGLESSRIISRNDGEETINVTYMRSFFSLRSRKQRPCPWMEKNFLDIR